MADSPADSSTIFISYSRRDAAFLKQFLDHLRPYVRAGAIPLWVDRQQIKPGDEWHQKIEQALEKARVVVLLVSARFLASDFVADEELPRLLEKAEQRQVVILPVILETCGFEETRLNRYQAINPPTRPLRRMKPDERNEAWQRIARQIKHVLAAPPTTPPAGVPISSGLPGSEPTPSHYPKPGTRLLTCWGHDGVVWGVTWAPDGARLASASWDETVRVWYVG
jgi:hypothetical protein